MTLQKKNAISMYFLPLFTQNERTFISQNLFKYCNGIKQTFTFKELIKKKFNRDC